MHLHLSRLRRFALSFVLPLALLLSQQGAVLHELSHWHMPTTSAVQTAGNAAADSDLCLACLAYAQVGHLAGADAPPAPAAEALRHHYVRTASRDVAEASTPALRSRGPPLVS
ncbi:MAG TPA: hypothetical protein VH328_13940 [Burkholderiaceae bacterium]|nr:hypothetical protein [Burkholderiaceae bacterium]